jgi:hypothetical protein
MSKKLTIGMAVYDDFNGAYFSLQAARLYHPEVFDDLEFIILDNNPYSAHGKELKGFVEQHLRDSNDKPNGRYIPITDKVSTSIRDKTFTESNTPYTLNMDCHVLVAPGAFKKLIDFYEERPETNDLYHGPMLYDNLRGDMSSTHMDPVWRAQMFGIWASDKRGYDPDGEPFEIPMHGMGLWTCRTESWAGFNPLFRGFGGEEGYIHQKVHDRGDKVWCLPFLQWMHRFQRPDGVKYVLTVENKVRNYLISAYELGTDPEAVVDHFKEYINDTKIRLMMRDVQREMGLVEVT